VPPKPSDCTFDLLSTRPDRPYDEMGVVEWDMAAVRSAREFVDLIREQTCRAGADAVLAEVNGGGVYVRGTVFKYRAVAAAASPAGGAAATVQPSPPSGAQPTP